MEQSVANFLKRQAKAVTVSHFYLTVKNSALFFYQAGL